MPNMSLICTHQKNPALSLLSGYLHNTGSGNQGGIHSDPYTFSSFIVDPLKKLIYCLYSHGFFGTRMVERGGSMMAEVVMSSKPMMEMSSGIRYPASLIARMQEMAVISLSAKMY